MTETPNLHLTKDAQTELYDVRRVNANSDKIDAFAGTVSAAINGLATVASTGAYSDLTGKPVIDDELDEDSTNAVQNKVVQAAIAAISGALLSGGKTLGANADLNTETDVGHFQCSTTNAASCANRPLDRVAGGFGGVNIPLYGDNRYIQLVAYNVVSGQGFCRIFLRFCYSTGLTGWFEVPLTALPAPASAQSTGGDASA